MIAGLISTQYFWTEEHRIFRCRRPDKYHRCGRFIRTGIKAAMAFKTQRMKG
jgi:hypothetical protein